MSKRLFDMFFSFIGLIFFSPFFLIISIAIKLESEGPVFYRGVRVGRHGKLFRIFKLRSMVADAEKHGVDSTSTIDFRLTRIGHIIRKFKLDEFSQLINVFIGDMSLVGPRPEVERFVNKYTKEEKKILLLRPGITDWSSIKFHNEGEIIEKSGIIDADVAYEQLIRPDKLRLQLLYLEKNNIWIDFIIIICTILTICSTRSGGQPIGVPRITN
ncbi:MAG: sugar transferase [Pseudomonadota bacterium]